MVSTPKTNSEPSATPAGAPIARKPRKDSPTGIIREALRCINERDLDGLRRLYVPDAVEEIVPLGDFHGIDAIVGYFRGMLAASPDFRMEAERIVASRGTVFFKWRATGTFSGAPFLGIEPTGRSIDITGIDCVTLRDGLIAANTVVYDGAGFSRQIGMLPPAGSRGERAMIGAFNGFTRAKRRLAR
jgi:predicted ester cyclase